MIDPTISLAIVVSASRLEDFLYDVPKNSEAYNSSLLDICSSFNRELHDLAEFNKKKE